MKNQVNLQSLALLALAMASTPAFADYVSLVARVKPCVVEIRIQAEEDAGQGTGFFITSDGYIMTNEHVIDGARRNSDIMVTATNGTIYPVEGLLYSNKDDDLAILKVDCIKTPYLQPDASDVEEGQAVVVVGSPKGFTGTVSTGIVAAVRRDEGLVQITAPVSPGSSGSPVLSEQGRVVAVVVGLFEGGQSINFAISLDKIRLAMASLPVKNAPSLSGAARSSVLHVQLPENQEALEDLLNDAYRALRGTLDSKSQELLRQEELVWLKQRNRFKDDPNAFSQATVDRIRLLKDSLIRNQ